jgi:peroxiredoxin Q/BCP
MQRILLFSTLIALLSLPSRAAPLKVGDAAPSVKVESDTGERVDLGEVYRKQTYTLVYFFPKADTPGCTKQGCSLRDAYADLQAKGVAVVGVSADSVQAQRAFKAKYHLPFVLLADTKQEVIKAFGVPTVAGLGFAKRQAYLVKEGRILWADYSASTEQQAADVLKVLGSETSVHQTKP